MIYVTPSLLVLPGAAADNAHLQSGHGGQQKETRTSDHITDALCEAGVLHDQESFSNFSCLLLNFAQVAFG